MKGATIGQSLALLADEAGQSGALLPSFWSDES
jgi:hypothetical protein